MGRRALTSGQRTVRVRRDEDGQIIGAGGEGQEQYDTDAAESALLRSYAWSQVMKWLRRKHRRINRKDLRRRYCGGGWWPSGEERTLFGKVRTT
ncbi:hypothetical protein [Actinacidiphila oryziradicis]|uniref:hypothetical protein n=1 Tax=Actinacidiphila oryziradicis TaxID=2571141 RepID=UPI001B808347|nr:hypothetical protein [Actinacidiphila oryziradicis]